MTHMTQQSLIPAAAGAAAPAVADVDAQQAIAALGAFSLEQSTEFRPIWYAVRETGFVSDVEAVPEMTGVVLAIRKARRHMVDDIETGQRVPECVLHKVNPDVGLTAEGKLRACATCPYNRWGSAVGPNGVPTRGKACREKRLILFLRDGDVLPVVVAAPPTSIRAVENWKNLLETKGVPLPLAHVTLRVKREQRGDKVFGILQINQNRILSPAEAKELWERVQVVQARVQSWLTAPANVVDERDDIEENGEETF